MNKRFLEILVCIVQAMALLGCCAEKAEPAETPKAIALVVSKDPVEGNDKHLNAEAQQAYKAFLKGKTSVTTSEKFREDDTNYNIDGLRYGTYSYAGLKSAKAVYEVCDSTIKYAFVNYGQDGVNELVIRFENLAPSLLNWRHHKVQ